MATKDRTIAKELTTSNSIIYTNPKFYNTIVESIIISNASSSATTFSIDWIEYSSGTTFKFAKTILINANSVIQITDGLYLQRSDVIQGLAGANSAITVFLKIKEDYSSVT